MANRFNADEGTGFRGGPADFTSTAMGSERGGFGAEQNPAGNMSQNMVSSQLPGNPHSSSGFRRAIRSAGRPKSSLKNEMPNKVSFGGKGYKKPSYFAQGGQRHGLHISTGAPHTAGATQEGADFGGS